MKESNGNKTAKTKRNRVSFFFLTFDFSLPFSIFPFLGTKREGAKSDPMSHHFMTP
ncbi:MAG: hypothetical protein WEE20_11900 [Bacteroidota bacterium]